MNEERLDWINHAPAEHLLSRLRECCAAWRWVDRFIAWRPFAEWDDVKHAAGRVWWELDETDWREAFAAHPRIGDLGSLRAEDQATRQWAAEEQSEASRASGQTMQALTQVNQQYEEKFGCLFIICAAGKSADQILASARRRLNNSPKTEMCIAAAEQLKITLARLEKLELP
jgi:2-oxo-4-hydroxy-4-carboxy-5-ureidoimidazoline decarboxylase